MLLLIGLILISLGMALFFLWTFFWAVKTGQYDDTETPPRRMLFEDTPSGNKDEFKTPK